VAAALGVGARWPRRAAPAPPPRCCCRGRAALAAPQPPLRRELAQCAAALARAAGSSGRWGRPDRGRSWRAACAASRDARARAVGAMGHHAHVEGRGQAAATATSDGARRARFERARTFGAASCATHPPARRTAPEVVPAWHQPCYMDALRACLQGVLEGRGASACRPDACAAVLEAYEGCVTAHAHTAPRKYEPEWCEEERQAYIGCRQGRGKARNAL
jgi:hypothetical protein